jgi:hypothetical protein
MEVPMTEAMAIVVGSFVLVIAAAFVAAHYRREHMRQTLLRQLDHHHHCLKFTHKRARLQRYRWR